MAQAPNSLAATAAKPNVMPAWDTRPVQTCRAGSGSMPEIRRPTATPSRIAASRSSTTASTRSVVVATASRRNAAPTATKNTTSTGGAASRTAVRSASPWATDRFSMTRPAAIAASSGSNCWTDPTWLSSAHTPSSTSGTSRAT